MQNRKSRYLKRSLEPYGLQFLLCVLTVQNIGHRFGPEQLEIICNAHSAVAAIVFIRIYDALDDHCSLFICDAL